MYNFMASFSLKKFKILSLFNNIAFIVYFNCKFLYINQFQQCN